MQSVIAWSVTSALLGIAATAFMLHDARAGVLVGAPLFVVWIGGLGVMLGVSGTWRTEAQMVRAYYAGRDSADQLKADIINRFSHAFATPLTPMANHIALLRNGHLGPLTERQAHSLEVLERNQRRLRGVIDEAVLASQVHGRRVPLAFERVDLASLVHEAAASVLAEGDRRIEVGLASMPVQADRDRLLYVFKHILRHAARGPDGTVQVDGRHYRDEVEVTLRYRTEDDPEASFGLLETATGADALELSLFTARGLIELHDGHLHIGRDDGHVMLSLRLPVAPVQTDRYTPRLARRA